MRQAICSHRVVTPKGIRPATILFEDGRISCLEPVGAQLSDAKVTDFRDLVVLPGLIDIHVHLNEPGRTEWEGFEAGTRAAATGGYTCVIDMPLNCIPSTTTVAALQAKRRAAGGKCYVDYAFWGGVVDANTIDVGRLAETGVRGFKCFLIHPGTDEFQMVTEAELRQVMPIIADAGLPLLVHAELPEPIQAAQNRLSEANADWRKYRTYLQSRPAAAEVEAIRLMIRLCREFRCRVHIVHLSAAEALDDLRHARDEGLPITVETCPHYLCFSAEQVRDGATEFKCAPPIRAAANREVLWTALREGLIDLLATDHSPCLPSMKMREQGDFKRAWGGISSLSVSLAACWTEARQRGFGFGDMVRWMAEKPAELAGVGVHKGRIAPGYDADFVIFDPDAEFVVNADRLYFRYAVSPYIGEKLRGQVLRTYLRGEPCWDNGTFGPQARGMEVNL